MNIPETLKPNPAYKNLEATSNTEVASSLQSTNPLNTTTTEEKTNKNNTLGIIGRTIGNLPTSIGKGLTSSLDNISDAPETLSNYVAQKQAAKNPTDYTLQLKAQETQKKFEEAKNTHLLGEGVQNWEKKIDERQESIMTDNPNSKLAEYGYKLNELGESMGAMAPTIAASAATSGLGGLVAGGAAAATATAKIAQGVGLAAMWADVYSRSTKESVDQGYDYISSANKAFGDATLEVATELMFGGIAGLGEGYLGKAVNGLTGSAGAEALKSATGLKKAGVTLAQAAVKFCNVAESHGWLGEALEEMTSEALSPFIERWTTNPDAPNATLGEIIEAGIGGAIMSVAMAPLGKVSQNIAEKKYTKTVETFFNTDADAQISLAKQWSFDGIQSKLADLIEGKTGTKLSDKATEVKRTLFGKKTVESRVVTDAEGKQTKVQIVEGISTPGNRRAAAQAIQKAIDNGKTTEALSTMWKELGDIWANEANARADRALSKKYNEQVRGELAKQDADFKRKDKAYNKAIAESEAAQAQYSPELEAQARERVKAAATDLDIAVRELDNAKSAQAKKRAQEVYSIANEAYVDATVEYENIKQAKIYADDADSRVSSLEKERNAAYDKAVSRMDSRLKRANAEKKYGKDAVDAFNAYERYNAISKGNRIVATDSATGGSRTFTRDEYREELAKSDPDYQKLKSKQAKEAYITNKFKQQQSDMRLELEKFAADVNASFKARNLGGKLEVVIDPNSSVAGYANGKIYFNPKTITSAMAADYYLAHEMFHFYEAQFAGSVEDLKALNDSVINMMGVIGYDYENWFKRVISSKAYQKEWDAMIKNEETKRKKDFSAEEKKNFKLKMANEETLARFMSVAFASRSILQCMALYEPSLLDTAEQSIKSSAVGDMINTRWDFARLQILKNIAEAKATPTDKEDNAAAIKEAEKQSGQVYNEEPAKSFNQLVEWENPPLLNKEDKKKACIKYLDAFIQKLEADYKDADTQAEYLEITESIELCEFEKLGIENGSIDIDDYYSTVFDPKSIDPDAEIQKTIAELVKNSIPYGFDVNSLDAGNNFVANYSEFDTAVKEFFLASPQGANKYFSRPGLYEVHLYNDVDRERAYRIASKSSDINRVIATNPVLNRFNVLERKFNFNGTERTLWTLRNPDGRISKTFFIAIASAKAANKLGFRIGENYYSAKSNSFTNYVENKETKNERQSNDIGTKRENISNDSGSNRASEQSDRPAQDRDLSRNSRKRGGNEETLNRLKNLSDSYMDELPSDLNEFSYKPRKEQTGKEREIQKLVYDAATMGGWEVPAFHASKFMGRQMAEFSARGAQPKGQYSGLIYTADNPDVASVGSSTYGLAKEYAIRLGDKPSNFSADGTHWRNIQWRSTGTGDLRMGRESIDEIALREIKNNGATTLIMDNINEGGFIGRDYILSDPSQIRSLEPIIVDQFGVVIPLDVRFGPDQNSYFDLGPRVPEVMDSIISLSELSEETKQEIERIRKTTSGMSPAEIEKDVLSKTLSLSEIKDFSDYLNKTYDNGGYIRYNSDDTISIVSKEYGPKISYFKFSPSPYTKYRFVVSPGEGLYDADPEVQQVEVDMLLDDYRSSVSYDDRINAKSLQKDINDLRAFKENGEQPSIEEKPIDLPNWYFKYDTSFSDVPFWELDYAPDLSGGDNIFYSEPVENYWNEENKPYESLQLKIENALSEFDADTLGYDFVTIDDIHNIQKDINNFGAGSPVYLSVAGPYVNLIDANSGAVVVSAKAELFLPIFHFTEESTGEYTDLEKRYSNHPGVIEDYLNNPDLVKSDIEMLNEQDTLNKEDKSLSQVNKMMNDNLFVPAGFNPLDADNISGVDQDTMDHYQELRQQYGGHSYRKLNKETGKYETVSNENGIPRKLNENTATSRTVDQMFNSTRVNADLRGRMMMDMLQGIFSHNIITNEDAISVTKQRIDSSTTFHQQFQDVMNRFEEKAVRTKSGKLFKWTPAVDKYDITHAEQVLVDMASYLKETTEDSSFQRQNESQDLGELYDEFEKLFAQTCAAGTRAGQNLQAFSLLKKLSPTGRLYYIQSEVENFVSEMVDRRGYSKVGGYKFKKDANGNMILDASGAPTPITISKDLIAEMEACTTTEEMNDVEEKIIQEIATQIPTNLMDRVVAWRYFAMLGNPRTHIRNIVSNFAMGTAVKAKNTLAGKIEDIYFKNEQAVGRTKTLDIDPELKKALEEFADSDWVKDNVKDTTLSGGKVGFATRIDQARNKLGFKLFGEQIDTIDKLSKKNMDYLELEDEFAAKRAYKEAFVTYCAANGLTPKYLSLNTVPSNTRLAQARSYAVTEAAKATYHDASDLASYLNKIENINGVTKIVLGGLVPFKKTPVNILKRGIEYSPVGLVNGAIDLVRSIRQATEFSAAIESGDKVRIERALMGMGEYSARTNAEALDINKADSRYNAQAKMNKIVCDSIDKFAAGLTGTGVMMLGLLLARLGLMKGSGDENDREEYYDQMLGNQEYSITIGNRNYTLDWLTPISMPMFTGVELYKVFSDGGLTFNEMLDSIGRLADPVMNLSVLQGINDAMSSYDSGLGKVALSAAEGYVSQFIPTAVGQLARSIDSTRRTTYAAKEGEGLGGDISKFFNKLENKIPGLSQTNSAYVDMWGREEVNDNNFLIRLFQNSVSPWYSKETTKTKADDLIANLYKETGDRSVIPTSPESSYTFGTDKTYYLLSNEYEATKKLVGNISQVGVTSLMETSGFADLDADAQADLVAQVYSYARKVAKQNYATTNNIAYNESGVAKRVTAAINAGVPIGKAIYINYMVGQMEADKDKSGKTISGSKKQKVLQFYKAMGLNDTQTRAISIYDID